MYVACRSEELWAALTTESQTRNWYLGACVDSNFEVGAAINFYATSEPGEQPNPDPNLEPEPGAEPEPEPETLRKLAISGEILEIENERRLVHSFRFADLDGESELRWTIGPVGGAQAGVVRVELEHEFSEDEGESEGFGRVRQGWPMALSALKTWLETGEILTLDGVSG